MLFFFSIKSNVFIFKNGQPVKNVIGAQSKENYKKAIEEAIASN
jgi:hypothetical protein